MTHIKRFNEMVSHPFRQYADWLDKVLIQKVIDGMKSGNMFKSELSMFNSNYPVKNNNKFPSNLGKETADWVDIDIVQDCIDRMNPHLSSEYQSERYKMDLLDFVQNHQIS
jgi:hypothetical protein